MGDRKNELVSVDEAEEVVAARLSLFARAQYGWYRRTESMARTPWVRDLRWVVVASVAAMVMLAAAVMLLAGTGLVENREPTPTAQPAVPKAQAPGLGP